MSIELRHVPGTAMAQTVKIRGHELRVDATLDEGGDDSGPNPHDLYDAALGACKALTLLWYARRKDMDVQEVTTLVERDASAERSGIYRLHTQLQVRGNVTDEQITQLEAATHKCPVHKLMTRVSTEISTEVQRMA